MQVSRAIFLLNHLGALHCCSPASVCRHAIVLADPDFRFAVSKSLRKLWWCSFATELSFLRSLEKLVGGGLKGKGRLRRGWLGRKQRSQHPWQPSSSGSGRPDGPLCPKKTYMMKLRADDWTAHWKLCLFQPIPSFPSPSNVP
jgi:hypothetical protein